MATMDDIAKRLGISKGTVSKALSGASDISEAMRKTVLETAVEMGYSRIPRANKLPRLCVFIENMEYEHPEDFGWDLVTGFRKSAEPAGYTVDLIPLDITIQREIHYDEYMLKHNYQGGFFLGLTFYDPWISDFKICRTPTVFLDNRIQYNPMLVHIGLDNDEGMDVAVKELKRLGHKTIGYLGGGLGSYVFQERYLSFFKAIKKHHMTNDRKLAGHSHKSTQCIEENLPRLLELGCTAIICSHDLLAHALMIHCQEKGIHIPNQLSIIGIDDLPICRYTVPSLTSIRQDRTQLGKSAYYALDAQINHIRIDSIRLHPELILRNSVGPAKSDTSSETRDQSKTISCRRHTISQKRYLANDIRSVKNDTRQRYETDSNNTSPKT